MLLEVQIGESAVVKLAALEVCRLDLPGMRDFASQFFDGAWGASGQWPHRSTACALICASGTHRRRAGAGFYCITMLD